MTARQAGAPGSAPARPAVGPTATGSTAPAAPTRPAARAGFAWGFAFDAQGQLRTGLFISLLSVWLLVGVFSYLNFYTRRRYFSIWTVAWLFYALYLTISYSLYWSTGSFTGEAWWATMVKQWCISTAAVFMLWGGLRFLGKKVRQISLSLFLCFLFFWSFVATYPWPGWAWLGRLDRLSLQLPIFVLIGGSSLVTVWGFLQYRRRRKYLGAGLLCCGFTLWGLFVAAYPFMEQLSDYMSTGFFLASVLQMFIAVNMIILVLEQLRYLRERRAAFRLRNQEQETVHLKKRVILTEERYRLLFEQSTEPIVITTQDDLRIVGLNPAAARVLGMASEQAQHTSLLQWFAPTGAALSGAGRGRFWFDSLCKQRLHALHRKDGSQVKVEVVGSAVDFAGETAFQFYLREVTERSRLEQQLRQAEKLSGLGQMVSGVVHELNNPLAVCSGITDALLEDPALPKQDREYVQIAARECQRAARLLRNFLNLAREGGSEKQPIKLNEIIRNVVELRRGDFRKQRVDLLLELDEQLPDALASVDQIQQILIILINNAMQAMIALARPGRLRIATRLQPEAILIVVEDSGPGVPVDLRSKIFEPFFTTKPVGEGTGLGLSLAHTFVLEHHGCILCDDSPLGGARFTVQLPQTLGPAARFASAPQEALLGPRPAAVTGRLGPAVN